MSKKPIKIGDEINIKGVVVGIYSDSPSKQLEIQLEIQLELLYSDTIIVDEDDYTLIQE